MIRRITLLGLLGMFLVAATSAFAQAVPGPTAGDQTIGNTTAAVPVQDKTAKKPNKKGTHHHGNKKGGKKHTGKKATGKKTTENKAIGDNSEKVDTTVKQ